MKARRLRDFVTEAGYSEEGLRETLGTVDPPMPQLRNLPRFLDLTRQTTRFNHLVRWFLLGQSVSKATAGSTTPDWFRDTCVELGLLRVEDDAYRSNILLLPFDRMLIASDCYVEPGATTPYDHVLTINPSARHTLNFTIRKPSRATLDLGTGCGIQAMAAARHSEDVVATDLNPRATAYATFNARLNGLENVNCLTGDLFAPVADRRFDLIVCCPPFVLAPAKEFLYRDNDMKLDRFCRHLAREAPAFLNDGGYFQMISEWVSLQGETWRERISEWFDRGSCDVWVLKHYSRSPRDYAQTRLRESFQVSPEQDAVTYSEWMDYYRKEGVEAMHGGLVTMRRRARKQWLVIEELNQNVTEPVGDAILNRFTCRDLLEAHEDDHRLLELRPRLLSEVRLERDSRPDNGHWLGLAPRLRLSSGFRPRIGVEPEVADFLVRLTGDARLGDLIQDLAAAVDVDPERVQAECLALVRLMIERGFLAL
jgi:hypothetical protein